EWGHHDFSFPKGLFLNLHSLIDPKEQRQIAKVYVAAFLETVFHEEKQYVPLFRNYRTGLAYLPDTNYYNQYEEAGFFAFARFGNETNDPSELTEGITSVAKNIKEKNRTARGSGHVLTWEQSGTFTLKSANGLAGKIEQGRQPYLAFTMAN